MKRALWMAFLLGSSALAAAQSRQPAQMTTLPTSVPQEFDVLDANGNWKPFKPSVGWNPKDAPWNAKCDNSTDDTTPLSMWAAAVKDGSVMRVTGDCLTKSPLVFPLAYHVTVEGDGYGASKLIYAGTDTTVTPFVFGQPDVNSGCSLAQWVVRDLSFESNTVMTAGDAVKFQGFCNSSFANLAFGGFGSNTNWFNGAHFIANNSSNLRGYYAKGHSSGTGLIVNGTLTTPDVALYATQMKISGFDLGVNFAGAAAGPILDQADILLNNASIKISQDQVAKGNEQIFLNAGVGLDLTFVGPEIDITDPGGSQPLLFLNGTWIASSATHCIVVEAGTHWQVNMTGGTIYNCGKGVVAAAADGVKNLSSSIVRLNGVSILSNTGYGVEATLANAGVFVQGVTFGNNTLGPYNSNVQPVLYNDGVPGRTYIGATTVRSTDGVSTGGSVKLLNTTTGATTPSKTMRVNNAGAFQLLNDAVSTVLFSIDDTGAVTGNSTINTSIYKAGGVSGFSGTKTAGTCVLTISGGIITNVTGC